ncbi:hypothetical protein EKK58_06585 [Candidatus Dependentiae bacterium]|nr:MAG: hypothetical protein EKK58_06585 [Candidatus Dependentiae bacterium]
MLFMILICLTHIFNTHTMEKIDQQKYYLSANALSTTSEQCASNNENRYDHAAQIKEDEITVAFVKTYNLTYESNIKLSSLLRFLDSYPYKTYLYNAYQHTEEHTKKLIPVVTPENINQIVKNQAYREQIRRHELYSNELLNILTIMQQTPIKYYNNNAELSWKKIFNSIVLPLVPSNTCNSLLPNNNENNSIEVHISRLNALYEQFINIFLNPNFKEIIQKTIIPALAVLIDKKDKKNKNSLPFNTIKDALQRLIAAYNSTNHHPVENNDLLTVLNNCWIMFWKYTENTDLTQSAYSREQDQQATTFNRTVDEYIASLYNNNDNVSCWSLFTLFSPDKIKKD